MSVLIWTTYLTVTIFVRTGEKIVMLAFLPQISFVCWWKHNLIFFQSKSFHKNDYFSILQWVTYECLKKKYLAVNSFGVGSLFFFPIQSIFLGRKIMSKVSLCTFIFERGEKLDWYSLKLKTEICNEFPRILIKTVLYNFSFLFDRSNISLGNITGAVQQLSHPN